MTVGSGLLALTYLKFSTTTLHYILKQLLYLGILSLNSPYLLETTRFIFTAA